MSHPNQELIDRVKCISLELPIYESAFNDAVQAEMNRTKSPDEKGDIKAIEPSFEEMQGYREDLAADLLGRGPACSKLAIALLGGLDVPKPYAFIFDAIVELEQTTTPEVEPFVLHHDRMVQEGATRRAIALAWYDLLRPKERELLTDKYRTKPGVVKKFIKDIDNLRAKRKSQKKRP